jgi:exopolysaccharide biosynthesis polyprenyl glycosylphosphotransferase
MNDITLPRLTNRRTPRARDLFARSLRAKVAARVNKTDPDSAADAESGSTWAWAYRWRLHITDLVIVAEALGAAAFVRFATVPTHTLSPDAGVHYLVMSVALLVAWFVSLAVFRTTDMDVIGVGASEYRRVVNATTSVFGLAATVFLVLQADSARWYLIVALPTGLVALLGSRWLWRKWLIGQRKLGHALSRVVIVGRLFEVARVFRQIEADPGSVYTVVGTVIEEADGVVGAATERGLPVCQGLEHAAAQAEALDADAVVVAGHPGEDGQFVHDLAWDLEGKDVDLVLATCLANVAGPRIHLRPVDGLPLLHVEIPHFEGGKHVLKRGLDVVVAGIALVLLAPLLVALAIAIRLDSPGPALFAQERVGRGGQTFRILKFRSMVQDASEQLAALKELNEGSGPLFKLRSDPRVTHLGHVLRKYSLDEFPQLWNVLVGDMSLVGPRPPLLDEVQTYQGYVCRRLFIKPGLTGMWQINGRSLLSWEDSVRLDLYYVENWSLVGDLMIMWRTLKVLVHPVGAF